MVTIVPHIRDHYRRIGVSHTRQIIWGVGQDVLARHSERGVCVFYFGTGEYRVRPDAARFQTVEFINSKNNFMSVAHRSGYLFPRPCALRRRRTSATGSSAARQLETFPYPYYLKAAVSVSGDRYRVRS